MCVALILTAATAVLHLCRHGYADGNPRESDQAAGVHACLTMCLSRCFLYMSRSLLNAVMQRVATL